ncbi:MAG: ABC transporter permease [Lachnospiraceae bacterium]|nr:ABC transporter permease [Lachnospiraceae bacterium]MCM1239314.1 ABC transporter permease [Lachnospiraceae bacterium]
MSVTLSKLSLRNARRQAGDYLIYFVTVVMVCAMLYAFNCLAVSEEIHKLSGMMDNMTLTIVLASIVVICIIGWLVSYTTGFMLSRRSRELGTYLLIGLENRQVARLFFLENLSVGGVALLFGVPLGNLVYQALRAILLTMFATPYHFRYDFSLKAIGLTCVYFATIYLFALIRSRKRIRDMKIYDLIYFERQNEAELVKKSKTRKTLFIASIVFGIVGTFLLMTASKLLIGVVGAGCIIVFIYGFFTSFSSGVPAYFERKPGRKYRGQNLMIFRTLTSKLATMGIVMATISLLFTATLLTEGSGMVFHGIFQGRLERNAFDLLFVSDQESRVDLCRENMAEQLSLSASWQYKLYQGEDDSIIDHLIETVGYQQYSYDHDFNKGAMMAFSDYAALRDMLGLPAAELEPDRYIIHCMPYLEESLRQWEQALSLDGKTLARGRIYTEQFAQNLWNGNGHQFLLVIPDAVCAGRTPIRYCLAAMTEYNITSEQYEALQQSLDGRAADGVHLIVSDWDLLYSKATNIADTAAWSAMSIFPLFYLALTLAMTAATVLTVQQLSEAGRYRRQFELLRKLGMDDREMGRTLLWQLAIYSLMPVIPPVLIAIPFILNLCSGTEAGTLVGANSPSVILAVSLGLFFLVYLVYTVVAYISMKRNVLPK